MLFLSPALLWFLLAAAVPVVIHLVNRRRHKTMKWAAMRFLLSATRQYRGEKKLRHIAILTCRALGIIALSIAAARPVISEVIGWGRGSINTVILILDRSASMEIKSAATNQSRRESALEKVAATIKNLGNPRLMLVDSASGDLQEIYSPELLASLSSTAPTDTSANIPSLLSQATSRLADIPGRTEIWIASDLQKSNWMPSDDRWETIRSEIATLPKPPAIRVLAMTGETSPNASIRITGSRRSGDELLLDVEIESHGNMNEKQTSLTTHLNGTSTGEMLSAAGSLTRFQKRINLHATQESGCGWLALPPDGNPRDNVAYFVYSPSRKPLTLIVSTPGETANYLALAAAPPGTNMERQIVSPEQALQKISPEFSAILWPSPMPEGPTAEAMQRFFASGGHACFFAPGTQSPNTFEKLAWSETQISPNDKFFVLGDWNRSDGPLCDGLDGTPVAAQRLKALRRQIPQGDITTLAHWKNGEPALARRIFDQGTAWMFGTKPDYSWSNLGDADVLLPLVQRIINQGHERFNKSQATTIGSDMARPQPGGSRIHIKNPGDEHTPKEYLAGVEKSDSGLLAINRPPTEDTIDPLDSDFIDSLLKGTRHTLLDRAGENDGSAASAEAWRLFLFAMLFFLIAEAVLCLTPNSYRSQSATPHARRE
jgi:hypothetical protein